MGRRTYCRTIFSSIFNFRLISHSGTCTATCIRHPANCRAEISCRIRLIPVGHALTARRRSLRPISGTLEAICLCTFTDSRTVIPICGCAGPDSDTPYTTFCRAVLVFYPGTSTFTNDHTLHTFCRCSQTNGNALFGSGRIGTECYAASISSCFCANNRCIGSISRCLITCSYTLIPFRFGLIAACHTLRPCGCLESCRGTLCAR